MVGLGYMRPTAPHMCPTVPHMHPTVPHTTTQASSCQRYMTNTGHIGKGVAPAAPWRMTATGFHNLPGDLLNKGQIKKSNAFCTVVNVVPSLCLDMQNLQALTAILTQTQRCQTAWKSKSCTAFLGEVSFESRPQTSRAETGQAGSLGSRDTTGTRSPGIAAWGF